MTTDEDRLHAERLAQFESLRNSVIQLMKQFGKPDFVDGKGDFCVIGDYWGYPQIKIDIHELALLQPNIVRSLQQVLSRFPEWEIVYTVVVEDHLYDWPDMGLYIRSHEILDTLQRQYLPKSLQDIKYEGSRRMTEDEVARQRDERETPTSF
jgi:hypothetical protein